MNKLKISKITSLALSFSLMCSFAMPVVAFANEGAASSLPAVNNTTPPPPPRAL